MSEKMVYFIECGDSGGRLYCGVKSLAEKAIKESLRDGFEVARISKNLYNSLAKTYRTYELFTDTPTLDGGEEYYIKGMVYPTPPTE